MAAPDEFASPSDPHGCVRGWVEIDELYITTHYGQLTPEQVAQVSKTTVMPCKVCRPTLFFRWVDGHLAADHDRKHCPDCLAGDTDERRPARPSHAPPPRRDLE